MGAKDSSLTRVQPVFNELLDRSPGGDAWLGRLWDMAVPTRGGVALPRPDGLGTLLASETPGVHADRLRKVYERTVPPPAAFLRWLLANPEKMLVRDPTTFGAKSPQAQQWRRKLFSGNPQLVGEAQAEGLKKLATPLAQHSRHKWWAFEGFTHIDCCLITDRCVLFIEGKRTEGVSPSTLWFQQRSQLWRNVEAAREFAGARQFAMMLAVENKVDGLSALADADASLVGSYPHLNPEQRSEMAAHFIGYVVWTEVVSEFNLPPDCLLQTVPVSGRR